MTRRARASSAEVVSRVAASLLGSYAFVWGITTAGVALGLRSGLSFEDARTLLHLLAFPALVTASLWAFAAPRLAVVWGVLLCGGAVLTAFGWLLV